MATAHETWVHLICSLILSLSLSWDVVRRQQENKLNKMYFAIARGFKFNYEFTRFYFSRRKHFVRVVLRPRGFRCAAVSSSAFTVSTTTETTKTTIALHAARAAAAAHSTRDLSDVECRHKNRVKSLDIGSAGAARVPFYARIHRFRLFLSPFFFVFFFFCYFHYGFSCRARLPCLMVRVH